MSGPANTKIQRVGDVLILTLEDEDRVVEVPYTMDAALELAAGIIKLAGEPAHGAVDLVLEQILGP